MMRKKTDKLDKTYSLATHILFIVHTCLTHVNVQFNIISVLDDEVQ